MGHYRSFGAQSLQYFDRAHEGTPPAPLQVPAAWRGTDMRATGAWRFELSPSHLAELDRAIALARGSGRAMGELSREDFPLPGLSAEIEAWRHELGHGRGFVLVRGVPVERLGEAGASLLFWCLGLHLGTPGAQNPQGDLLGHVIDTGDDRSDPLVRLYRTSSDIAYHCDAADVVGLLCLTKARRGGLSRIASSVTVFNEILRRRPDLAPRLFEPFALDLRNEEPAGMRGWVPIPPCRHASGALRTFYHSDYLSLVGAPCGRAAPLGGRVGSSGSLRGDRLGSRDLSRHGSPARGHPARLESHHRSRAHRLRRRRAREAPPPAALALALTALRALEETA